MAHLAANGWVCVAANYRRSPAATFPDHLVDAKRALAWIRAHVAAFGGDADRIVVTGGSAGGHLAALVALTPENATYQPGFETADTSVAAAVCLYGVYDLLDRGTVPHKASMAWLLRRFVLKSDPVLDRAGWEAASPITRIRPTAPPFLLVHGTHDTLVPVEEAREFATALQSAGAPVTTIEAPGAQHAFDILWSDRTARTVEAVHSWLDQVVNDTVDIAADAPQA